MNYDELLLVAIRASVEAGEVISEVYRSDFAVQTKEDRSPLTLADTKSNELITKALMKTGLPILSEEGKNISYEDRKQWKQFWLVDPLDGTKEFIKRNGEFTVNIALIEKHTPVMGVIYVPEKKMLYFATINDGSYRMDNINKEAFSEMSYIDFIKGSKKLPIEETGNTFRVVGSRSHMSKETEDFIENLKKDQQNVEIVSIGSSLKLCLVAEGSADIYPRFGPTMEWDTAAGHAIAIKAGKKVTHADMTTMLKYNKESLLNPYFIVY